MAAWHPTAKSRRCYHRVISGLERGGTVRFLTLTSTHDSSPDIHRHFRALVMRLRRRNLMHAYIQVTEFTKSGLAHKHILFRGSYIDQALLSHWWQQIHGAKVVDIRQVRRKSRSRTVASEMAKYLAKENALRYSWSWEWVWRGFARDWARLKARFNELLELGVIDTFLNLLQFWRVLLKWGKYVDPLEVLINVRQQQEALKT